MVIEKSTVLNIEKEQKDIENKSFFHSLVITSIVMISLIGAGLICLYA